MKGSGALFGVSWPAFGRFWVALGSSWAALGRLLGPFWALLGISCLVWGASGLDFGSQGPPGPRFWRVWGRAGLGFRVFGVHVLTGLLLRLALCYLMFFLTQSPETACMCVTLKIRMYLLSDAII